MPIRIRNWEKFQQYRDREPKWIKLHRSLNRNYEWCQLSDKARAQLVGLWLLAAELGNEIPNDHNWIRGQISANGQLALDELVTSNFVEVYDGVQNCTELYLETERERETEERQSRGPQQRFTPPTVDQVAAHCAEKGYTFDPEVFVAYYTANGWKVGRSAMKSWQAACVTWQKREGKSKAPMRVGATSDSSVWMFDTYRRADYEAHHEHLAWDDYLAAAADYPARTAPTFETWLEG